MFAFQVPRRASALRIAAAPHPCACRTAKRLKGMEPGMRRDVSLPASLLPRDARQLAKSLRSPSPAVRGGEHQATAFAKRCIGCDVRVCPARARCMQVRDDGGAQLPPTRASAGSRASSTVSGVAQKDVGNLDAGLGDILRRSRRRGGSARSNSGRSSARSVTPIEHNGVSRQSSKASLDGRFFAP